MAEEKNTEQEEPTRFPVLTVLKNNAILKNIFIVVDDHSEDQTVLIGRHPDCNIVLMHPSVSRFHLRIRSNPSSRTLSLIDLASVHGTWVRGRKLEPGVSVELKEGDTFTVGVSTRIYRLCWIPLTQFHLFLPHQQQYIIKDENLELSAEQEIPMSEDIVSPCCDEERKSHSEDETLGVLNGTETSCFPTNSGCENISYDCQLSPPYIQSPPYARPVDECDNTEKIEACPEVEMPGETNLLCTLREYLTHNICMPVVEAVQGTKMQQFQSPHDSFTGQSLSSEMHWSSFPINIDPTSFDEKDVAAVAVIPTQSKFGCTHGDNDKFEGILTTEPTSFSSENTCLIVDEDIPDSQFHQMEVIEELSADSIPYGEKQDESLPTNIDSASFHEKDVAAVSVIPTESEFGFTRGDNDKVKGILTTGPRTSNSENMCLIVDEDVPDSEFRQMEDVEEVSLDSVPGEEKQDEKGLAAVTQIPTESELGCALGENERIVDILEMESRTINSENTSLPDEEAIPVDNFQLINVAEEVAMDSISEGEKEKCGKELESKLSASLNAKSCHEQGMAEIAEDTGKKCPSCIFSTSFQVESPNSSILPQEVVFNIKIEKHTPQSLTAVTGCSGGEFPENDVEPTEESSTFGSINSRCKVASAPQVRARKSRFMSTAAKVGTEVKRSNVKNVVINKSMPKDLSSLFDEEKEAFTPNKENLFPNTYHLRFVKRKGKLDEIKHSMSQRSPNLSYFIPNIYSAKRVSTVSNKVNQTPKVALEWKSQRKPLECRINLVHVQDTMELKKNRVERVKPFQSPMNSGGNHKSVTVSAAQSIDDVRICGQISNKYTKPSHSSGKEQKRSWDMVVDSASLMNKESRKALQLLQGLKGTRLIIPRLVIEELGSMKQQFRIFRTTSEASLALKWIEECLEKTRWWIHIQSSMEECRLTAPTSLASPQTQFIEESWSFSNFKISKKCTTTPTVEDHILDCALQYRRKENVEQLVLLSDDLSLKIKSMAKGLLCETVQQFRHSLVNPFSERFMWPKSSPRGLTWSCRDDLVLREKYFGLPSKAGLKLITEPFL